MAANTKDIASACSDLATRMGVTLFVLQQLIELAIQRMPSNTDSDHSEAAVRAASRYVGDLHEIKEQLYELTSTARKGSQS
jgi:hypothetical protein